MGPAAAGVVRVEEERRLVKATVSSERLGVVLRVMTAMVGVAVVIGLGMMVWSAANSRAVVVDPFDSPFDLTRRGHSGQVIARSVADVVTTIGADPRNASENRAVALNWTPDVAGVVALERVGPFNPLSALTHLRPCDRRGGGGYWKVDWRVVE